MCLSCNKRSNSFVITDFSRPKIDTLAPMERGIYTAALFKIEGYCNDTIKIKFNGFELKYSGIINDHLNLDYYGSHKVDFMFIPYRATKGKLSISYGI